jgi:hypothetical protein
LDETVDEHISKLELIWRTRQGGSGRTRREYLDFVIDGQSLYDLLRPGDFIGCLGWLQTHTEQQLVEELLLKRPPELETGRNMLYICPECGDIECGAITVRIEKTGECFVWKDFRYENGDGEIEHTPQHYVTDGPFRFNKAEYWQTLTNRPSSKVGNAA